MALTCNLSELIYSIERSMIPQWAIEAILANKDCIVCEINAGREFTLFGPDGQSLTIKKSISRSLVSRIVQWFRK